MEPARAAAAARPRALLRPALRRIPGGARLAELSRVLHLLPAPDPVHVSDAIRGEHPRRAVVPRGHARTAAHRVPRSAVLAGTRSRARAVRRHQVARAGAHVRVRYAARW